MKGTIKKNSSPSVRYDSVSSRLPSGALLPSKTVRIARGGPPTGDKFSDVVSQLQLIARVTNGIALQIGFVESSIPGNDVIAELLHMGSLKPDFLATMKASDVTAIVDLMKKASAGLTDSADVTKVEDRYVNLNSIIRAKFDYDAFKNLNGKGEFKGKLDSLVGAPPTDSINDIVVKMEDLRTALDRVDKMKSDTKNGTKNHESTLLASMHGYFNNIEKAATDYEKMMDVVKDLQDLRKKSSFVQQLIAADKAVSYQKTALLVPTTEGQVTTNMDAMKQLGSELEKHLEMLNNVYSFIETFQASRQSVFKYSAGFPNGVRDLENLSTDTDNKVFQKSAGLDQKKSQELKLGLLPLGGFKTSLKNVENAWQPAKQKADTAKDVVFEQMAIANLVKNADVRSNTMNKFTTCYETHAPNAGKRLTDIAPILQLIHHLNANVTELSTIKFVAPEFDLAALRKATDFKDLQTITLREAATPDMVRKLKKMPEVAETIAKLDTFLKAARSVETMIDNVYKNANATSHGFLSIEEYHDEMAKSNLGDWIKCLQDIGEDGETVVRMIESIRYLRKFAKMPSTTDAQEFLTTIQQSASLLKTSNDVIDAMKSGAGAEAKAFSHLQNANNVSSSLGMAVQGLTQIKRFQDSRTQLTALTGEVALVETFADMMQGELTQEVYDTLKEMGSLPKLLNETFDAIVAMAPFADKLDVTDMKSYKPLFEVAAKIKGFAVDSKQMKAALETLARKDATFDQQLANVRALLDALDPLDLDFSRYNVAAGASSLDALDSFFVTWSTSVAVIKSETEKSGGNIPLWAWVLIAGGSVILLAGVPSGAYYGGHLYVKRKNRIKKEAEIKANWAAYEKKRKEKIENAYQCLVALLKELMGTVDQTLAKESTRQNENNPIRALDRKVFNALNMLITFQIPPEGDVENENKIRAAELYRQRDAKVVGLRSGDGDPKPFIHASFMNSSKTLLAGQAPIGADVPDKVSTVLEHLMMIEQHEIELIVQLCNFTEDDQPTCAKYYPELGESPLTFGSYTLRTIEQVNVSDVITASGITVLEVEYSREGNSKRFKVLRHREWPDRHAPPDIKGLVEIVRYMEKFKNNVFVHCSTGVGRTGVVIAVKKALERLESDGNCPTTLILFMEPFWKYRCAFIQNIVQVLTVVLATVVSFREKHGITGFSKEYCGLSFCIDKAKQQMDSDNRFSAEDRTAFSNGLVQYLTEKENEYNTKQADAKQRSGK